MQKDPVDDFMEEASKLPGWLTRNLTLMAELDRRAAQLEEQLTDRRARHLSKIRSRWQAHLQLQEHIRETAEASAETYRRADELTRASEEESLDLSEILQMSKEQKRLLREKAAVGRQCYHHVEGIGSVLDFYRGTQQQQQHQMANSSSSASAHRHTGGGSGTGDGTRSSASGGGGDTDSRSAYDGESTVSVRRSSRPSDCRPRRSNKRDREAERTPGDGDTSRHFRWSRRDSGTLEKCSGSTAGPGAASSASASDPVSSPPVSTASSSVAVPNQGGLGVRISLGTSNRGRWRHPDSSSGKNRGNNFEEGRGSGGSPDEGGTSETCPCCGWGEHDGDEMVACDGCDHWFHFNCVVSEEKRRDRLTKVCWSAKPMVNPFVSLFKPLSFALLSLPPTDLIDAACRSSIEITWRKVGFARVVSIRERGEFNAPPSHRPRD